MNYIINNRHILLLTFSCAVVAITKTVIPVWSNLYLSELWSISPSASNHWASLGALLGFLVAGWYSDKFFHNQRWFINILFHLGVIFLLLAFWLTPIKILIHCHHYITYGIYFFIIGLQLLTFVMAVELAHDKIRGTFAGFIMLLSFLVPALSNAPVGIIIQYFGWNCLFAALCVCLILSATGIWFCRSLKTKILY